VWWDTELLTKLIANREAGSQDLYQPEREHDVRVKCKIEGTGLLSAGKGARRSGRRAKPASGIRWEDGKERSGSWRGPLQIALRATEAAHIIVARLASRHPVSRLHSVVVEGRGGGRPTFAPNSVAHPSRFSADGVTEPPLLAKDRHNGATPRSKKGILTGLQPVRKLHHASALRRDRRKYRAGILRPADVRDTVERLTLTNRARARAWTVRRLR